MNKIKVGVAGYGTIGQRLADGIALQEDMELVGVAGRTPSLGIRALKEKGMPYDLYLVDMSLKPQFDELGIPVQGSLEDLADKVDVMLDSAPGGKGEGNKDLYIQKNIKAIFQGGEKNTVADVFFHSYANYDLAFGKDFLKLTSCNTTGLIRSVATLDRVIPLERVTMTIVRRFADPGDYHRGLTNALKIDKAPSHQAVDLMHIMPHIHCTGILVHTPVTHGHIITMTAVAKDGKKITKEAALAAFEADPRIRVVSTSEGFLGNASLFKYARDLGNSRGDMYEIGLWRDSMVETGNDIMYAVNIPQEAVAIPETLDAVRAACKMQDTAAEATALTNKYLHIGAFKA